MMKSRMAEIAEEEGVYLDCSSRLERGILSYGPSRAEFERARRDSRAVDEVPRVGPALESALAEVRANAATLRDLSMLAGLTGFAEVAFDNIFARQLPFEISREDSERAGGARVIEWH